MAAVQRRFEQSVCTRTVEESLQIMAFGSQLHPTAQLVQCNTAEISEVHSPLAAAPNISVSPPSHLQWCTVYLCVDLKPRAPAIRLEGTVRLHDVLF